MHAVIDTLPFRVMTWPEWKRAYRQRIRVNSWISGFKKMVTEIHVATPATKLVLPWYDKRKSEDHFSGNAREVRIGAEPILIRIPAVRFKNWFLIVDGCHRLTELEPGLVILDCIVPTKRQRRGIGDMQHDWWQRRGV